MDAAVIVGELLPARLTFGARHEAIDERHAHPDGNTEIQEFSQFDNLGAV